MPPTPSGHGGHRRTGGGGGNTRFCVGMGDQSTAQDPHPHQMEMQMEPPPTPHYFFGGGTHPVQPRWEPSPSPPHFLPKSPSIREQRPLGGPQAAPWGQRGGLGTEVCPRGFTVMRSEPSLVLGGCHGGPGGATRPTSNRKNDPAQLCGRSFISDPRPAAAPDPQAPRGGVGTHTHPRGGPLGSHVPPPPPKGQRGRHSQAGHSLPQPQGSGWRGAPQHRHLQHPPCAPSSPPTPRGTGRPYPPRQHAP